MRRRKTARERARARKLRQQIEANDAQMVLLWNHLQLTAKWQDWNGTSIELGQARAMVRAGHAEAVTRLVDGAVRVVGYQATAVDVESAGAALPPSQTLKPTPATLTVAVMHAVARADDPKKARGDAQAKLTRGERAHVLKFRVWPVVPESFRDAAGNLVEGGVYKSPTIRPRLPLAQRTAAEALLAAGPRLGLNVRRPAVARLA